MAFPIYRTRLSCIEAEKSVKLTLPCKVQSFQPHCLATVIYSLKCYMFSVNIRVFNMYTHKQRQPGVWKGEKKNWRLEWKDHCLTQCLKIWRGFFWVSEVIKYILFRRHRQIQYSRYAKTVLVFADASGQTGLWVSDLKKYEKAIFFIWNQSQKS